MGLILKIITPIGIAIEKEVRSVTLPSSNGEIEILPGHLPLLTILTAGELVARGKTDEFFAIDSGFAKIFSDRIYVLTDESLNINDTDLIEIEKATERAEKALEDARNSREKLDPAEIEMLDAKVKYQMATKLVKIKH